MNILVINCSPVKNGATAEIVKLVGQNVNDGNEVRTICIDDYDVKFCRGCRKCHETAKCFQDDDVNEIIEQYEWADKIVSVSPSYWADIPGQFKAFIDRCTPWCNTHEPHATIPNGKKGYTIALRTGPSMPECEKIIGSIEHFYGHLEIKASGHLGLCSVESKENVAEKIDEIKTFCDVIINSMKPLSEMTLEELWELFPIFLVEHNEKWAKDYSEMEVVLKNIFSDCHIIRISHIGSTAIKDIYAKDIVDILVETDDIEKAAKIAERNGFIRMLSSSKRVTLNRGYTPEGFADKVYHLHIRHEGDNNELYFRDYLNEHPEVAKEYERMKLDLWKKYEHNRDAYTEAKTEFVEKWTSEAHKLYDGRY